jgi:hypothetical protein
MSTTYRNTSPYATTSSFGQFLDVLSFRKLTKHIDDVVYSVDNVYKYRPDLLASDLYGDSSLWWVFAARNPNVIKDPIFDFYPGVIIYIPKKANLTTDLGL